MDRKFQVVEGVGSHDGEKGRFQESSLDSQPNAERHLARSPFEFVTRSVKITARSREEALTKMRNELQYRMELCSCSGESVGAVELQLSEDFNSGQTAKPLDAK